MYEIFTLCDQYNIAVSLFRVTWNPTAMWRAEFKGVLDGANIAADVSAPTAERAVSDAWAAFAPTFDRIVNAAEPAPEQPPSPDNEAPF